VFFHVSRVSDWTCHPSRLNLGAADTRRNASLLPAANFIVLFDCPGTAGLAVLLWLNRCFGLLVSPLPCLAQKTISILTNKTGSVIPARKPSPDR
jgi:hypothetical protein